jgi:hypothetical protein
MGVSTGPEKGTEGLTPNCSATRSQASMTWVRTPGASCTRRPRATWRGNPASRPGRAIAEDQYTLSQISTATAARSAIPVACTSLSPSHRRV